MNDVVLSTYGILLDDLLLTTVKNNNCQDAMFKCISHVNWIDAQHTMEPIPKVLANRNEMD